MDSDKGNTIRELKHLTSVAMALSALTAIHLGHIQTSTLSALRLVYLFLSLTYIAFAAVEQQWCRRYADIHEHGWNHLLTIVHLSDFAFSSTGLTSTVKMNSSGR